MTESCKGFAVAERRGKGEDGGVRALVYMTALVPSVGETALGMMGKLENPGEVVVDVSTPYPRNSFFSSRFSRLTMNMVLVLMGNGFSFM